MEGSWRSNKLFQTIPLSKVETNLQMTYGIWPWDQDLHAVGSTRTLFTPWQKVCTKSWAWNASLKFLGNQFGDGDRFNGTTLCTRKKANETNQIWLSFCSLHRCHIFLLVANSTIAFRTLKIPQGWVSSHFVDLFRNHFAKVSCTSFVLLQFDQS